MDIAVKILEENFRCDWSLFLLYGAASLLGVSIVALRTRVWLKHTDKFLFCIAIIFAIGVLLLYTILVLLPLHKDMAESSIFVIECTYEHRNQRGDQTGTFSTGTVYVTLDDGETHSYGMPNLQAPEFQPYLFENFPAKGPLRVRLYYAEHSNLALYMEVIE